LGFFDIIFDMRYGRLEVVFAIGKSWERAWELLWLLLF
jgi:hypothetical protein